MLSCRAACGCIIFAARAGRGAAEAQLALLKLGGGSFGIAVDVHRLGLAAHLTVHSPPAKLSCRYSAHAAAPGGPPAC